MTAVHQWLTVHSAFPGKRKGLTQCCGSGTVSGSGFGSRKAKMTHKHRKKLINFIFGSAGCSLLRSEGCSCTLDLSKFQILIKKDILKIFCRIFPVFDHQNLGSGFT
jgi:hypothetical protein